MANINRNTRETILTVSFIIFENFTVHVIFHCRVLVTWYLRISQKLLWKCSAHFYMGSNKKKHPLLNSCFVYLYWKNIHRIDSPSANFTYLAMLVTFSLCYIYSFHQVLKSAALEQSRSLRNLFYSLPWNFIYFIYIYEYKQIFILLILKGLWLVHKLFVDVTLICVERMSPSYETMYIYYSCLKYHRKSDSFMVF